MTPSYVRKCIPAPDNNKKVLLHSCCAPCSGEVIEAMQASGIDLTIFFYNPNIHPMREYELRKNENIRFAAKLGIPFVDMDYDRDNWFLRARGMEHEPERGINMAQINECGIRAASRYPNLSWWDYNWRKGGGSARMIEISKRENFYQQEYCGCAYSLRDTNLHRIATGRERIVIGENYYGVAPGDGGRTFAE